MACAGLIDALGDPRAGGGAAHARLARVHLRRDRRADRAPALRAVGPNRRCRSAARRRSSSCSSTLRRWPGPRAGSSGSIAAARSPTASAAIRATGALAIAKVLSSDRAPLRRRSASCSALGRRAADSRRATSAWARRSRPTRCSSGEGAPLRARDHARLRRPARRSAPRRGPRSSSSRSEARRGCYARGARGRRARGRRAARVLARPDPARLRADARAAARGAGSRASRSWCCTRTRAPALEREIGGARARGRLRRTSCCSHEVAARDRLARARRDRRRRRLPDAAPARLRRARCARELPGSRLALHAVERRAHRRRALPRPERDPLGAGGRCASRTRTSRARSDATRAIGFDMGGTSTDVSRVDATDGELERALTRREIAGVRVSAPMMRDPHRRGRRRLDLSLRRLPLQRRPRERGRRARARSATAEPGARAS